MLRNLSKFTSRRLLHTSSGFHCANPENVTVPSINLAFERFDPDPKDAKPDQPPMVIVHGLFGSKRNWRSMAKAFNKRHGLTVFAVDLRNHGESPHANSMNYDVMAKDLQQFFDSQRLEKISLVGHSMGGKASMHYALGNGPYINKMVIVDIAPISLKPSSSFDQYIEAMRLVEAEGIPSHMQADKFLQDQVKDAHIRAFLLTNFKFDSEDKVLRLQINLDEISANMKNIWDFPFARSSQHFDKPTLFLNGGKSNYLLPEMYPAVRRMFPQMSVFTIENAGHWVHFDAPEVFINTVANFVKE